MPDTMLDGFKERITKAAKIHQSVGIIIPVNNYRHIFDAIFSHMLESKDDVWVYISITKSFDTVSKTIKNISDHKNIKFIDCISQASGISKIDKNCIYIESPALMEKIILEMLNIFRNVKEGAEKYVIIDSLSALAIYNDIDTVREFYKNLINRTRAEDIHSITLGIKEGDEDEDIEKILNFSEKILKIKESFI